MFKYIENVFPKEVIDSLHRKYFDIHDSDLVSYDIWVDSMTMDKTLPKNYIQNFSKKDQIQLLTLLYKDSNSPFYNNKRIMNSKISVQKITKGSSIPKHTDTAIGSLTVFLNKEYDTFNGGEFVWWDNEDAKESYSVIPKYNCGVWALNDSGKGAPHEVATVNNYTRSSIQLFMYTTRKNNAIH